MTRNWVYKPVELCDHDAGDHQQDKQDTHPADQADGHSVVRVLAQPDWNKHINMPCDCLKWYGSINE